MSLKRGFIRFAAYAAFSISLIGTTYLSPAHAQPVEIEGTASVSYDGGLFSGRADEKTRQQTLRLAEVDAINRYASGFSASKFKLYQKAESTITANVTDYVSEPIIIDEGYKKSEKKYSVVIRTSVNANRMDAALSSGSGVGSSIAGGPTRKISISFLFAARSATSVKQFQDRSTSVDVSKSDKNAKQSEGLVAGRATYSSTSSDISENTSGGNTVRQADDVTYSVQSPEDVNTAMSMVFSDNGFDEYDYRDVNAQCGGAKPELLYNALSTSNMLSGDLRRSAFMAAKKCEINTFAIGTLDVGLQDTDPVTGQKRVYVSVRAQLNDLSGVLPKVLASVGPIQYSGLGPNQDVASRNALINAATEAAKEISNQLKSKGMN